ncbi:electron transfer flavoprotein-ubiquinone oxidoreductase, partial [Endobacterium cereale]|uniref:electron transfer flavoprotein-ubiquinone oxidoreductase n=1 Tax=Endobacterium cereale TaxID=2663029 RepID=UPI001F33352D
VPKLTFPGGALIGCSAGLVNVPRIKGSHNAVLSGMLAADKLAEAIAAGRANDEVVEIENEWRDGPIGKDLKSVRNVKPLWSKLGTVLGVSLGGLDMWTNQLLGFSFFGTLKHGKTDAQSLEPAKLHKKIEYPKPDGVLTFDRLSSVFLSNTNHEEDQPVHLQVKNRAELRALQDLRHQGPQPEHQLGPAAGGRRPGLSEYVTFRTQSIDGHAARPLSRQSGFPRFPKWLLTGTPRPLKLRLTPSIHCLCYDNDSDRRRTISATSCA